MRRDRSNDREPRTLTRRDFHRLGGAALLAAGSPLLATRAAAESDALVGEYPENAPIIAGVQYVDVSAKEGQYCSGCLLYQAGGPEGRGKCPLFAKGLVADQGWCVSWSKKP
ncbi:MAG: high-potential iron-sulfur protein [Myxococcota bacterium]|nr:high-potential iron-sulfur protein [Myxococcota bacterium]